MAFINLLRQTAFAAYCFLDGTVDFLLSPHGLSFKAHLYDLHRHAEAYYRVSAPIPTARMSTCRCPSMYCGHGSLVIVMSIFSCQMFKSLMMATGRPCPS